jgi:adenylate cyclase
VTLIDDLRTKTAEIVHGRWAYRDGTVVPETEDVALGNEAVKFEATFLYADLADSTELAITDSQIAAEVFKAYLMGTTRIIRASEGDVRSFDGDRVMGVFLGDLKNTHATEAGLKINYFFWEILNKAFADFYQLRAPALRQCVGIDTSEVRVVRSGIRDNNDLVWVGRAPNVAAKLSSIREHGYSTYISSTVFGRMAETSKTSNANFGNPPNTLMWEAQNWADGVPYGVDKIYRSGWQWHPDY